MENIPLQLPNSFDDFENFLLGNPSSLFPVWVGAFYGTILSMQCCLILSEMPELHFADIENSLVRELGCRQGAASRLKASCPIQIDGYP